jgi:hypothetical protein
MAGDFGRSMISQILDPALAGRWLAIVDGKSAPELVVESINPATLGLSATQRTYGGKVRQYAGASGAVTLSVVFYETHDMRTLEFLDTWRRIVFDPDTSTYGLPVEYKRVVEVMMFPLTSSTKPVAMFTMEGAWPVNVSGLDLSYANQEGRLVQSVEMACDTVSFRRLA